jgi:hypothetical protein
MNQKTSMPKRPTHQNFFKISINIVLIFHEGKGYFAFQQLNLMKALFKSCFTLFCLLTVLSCKIDQDKKVDRQKFRFKVGADSNLFFRNVRQIYYDRESPDGKWQAYRLIERYKQHDRPCLYAVIVIHWIKDEAYLLIENNDAIANEDFLSIIIKDSSNAKLDTIQLKDRGRERMLEFASKIYEAIQEKKYIAVLQNGSYVPIFQEKVEREAFRITMGDFYRLTKVF